MKEYGDYLEEVGFKCLFPGNGQEYARYEKDNIEVWMYGKYTHIYETLDKSRRCPTCGQRHDYKERNEIFENRDATLDQIKHTLSTLPLKATKGELDNE